MRTIETAVYTFDELSNRAKERARDWYREGLEFEADFEFAETAAKLLGITFATRTIRFNNGGTDEETDIRYSGFCSQGDGASFVGSYEFVRGCAKAVRKEYPNETVLHAIADGLSALQAGYLLQHAATLRANISQSGHYYHKYTMTVEALYTDADGEEIYVEEEHEKQITELMRDFAQWIYDGLKEDYDARMSDEWVDENIIANEYEFTEEGEHTC